jgi:4'-phosphopantetheinyl transferase
VERARGLRFEYGARGKPALGGDDSADSALTFNLSHSHGLAVYAVARGRDVGVDVERIRPGREHDLLAARFFSPQEAAALRAMPDRLRLRAFYACWTRKEAFMKARGEGFALSLRRFSVSVDPDGAPVVDDVEGAPEEPLRWTLCDLEPGPGYAGALAVEGRSWRLRSWRLGP